MSKKRSSTAAVTSPPELIALGQRIKARREELGLSQEEVAGDRLSRSHLSNIERGRHWPSDDVVVHLEQALRVPPGTYLKPYTIASAKRWGRNRSYATREAPPPRSAASRTTALYLVDGQGRFSRLAPKILSDYGPPAEPPYVITSQRIAYTVDTTARCTSTDVTWTITPTEDGVKVFDFTRSQPVGQIVERIDLRLIEGATFAGIARHGRNLFHIVLRLPGGLRRGHRHEVRAVVELRGLHALPIQFVNTASHGQQLVELTVCFPNSRPKDLWWYQDLPHDATPGMMSPARQLRLDANGAAAHTFTTRAYRLAHGIAWTW